MTVADGKGIWTVEIRRAASPTGSPGAPMLGVGPTPFKEPYIAPYGHVNENLLVIEFEGNEIPPPLQCPTGVTLKAEQKTSSGAWVPVATCAALGTDIRFTATPVPAGAYPGLQ